MKLTPNSQTGFLVWPIYLLSNACGFPVKGPEGDRGAGYGDRDKRAEGGGDRNLRLGLVAHRMIGLLQAWTAWLAPVPDARNHQNYPGRFGKFG